MRIEWLNKRGSDRVIVFFNGWGMDVGAVSHLTAECDVLVCYDYRNLSMPEISPVLKHYREVIVVAWSMGVWAAANVISMMDVYPTYLVALNGTEHPVDDRWGIPKRVYLLTEERMNAQAREKFVQRMFSSREEAQCFCSQPCSRTCEEVCEELTYIRTQSTVSRNEVKWDKAYVSEGDLIFPPGNQLEWWKERFVDTQILPGGHYPFYNFRSWEEIIRR